jgi:hypothetical protein
MPDYPAYIFGKDGHRFIKVPEFLSDHRNDETAMKAARKLVDGHDVEVWDGNRLVVRFTPAEIKTLREWTNDRVRLAVEVEKEPA